MWVRVAAALVGLVFLVPTVVFGGVLGVDLLCWLVLPIGVYEYAKMALPARGLKAFAAVLLGAGTLFGTSIYLGTAWLGPVAVACLLLAFLAVMAWSQDMEHAADESSRLLFGMLYVGGLLLWLPLIRRWPDGLAAVFLLLAATWLGDSGAYFAGRAFGRHKLAPRLSPKKTWEGAIGGLLASMAGAMLVVWVALPGLSLLQAALLGAIVDISGVLGDLAESMLKRSCGVKDSGRIMPGHGGILDRIDSILFSAPALYLALHLPLFQAAAGTLSD